MSSHNTAILESLHSAGWKVNSNAFLDQGCRRVWVVSGSKGDHCIRAEGRTCSEACLSASEQVQWLEAGPGLGPKPRPARRPQLPPMSDGESLRRVFEG
jgi:hypothetical protein